MKKYLLLALVILLPASLFADTYVTIGDVGSSSDSDRYPMYRYYAMSATSTLYFASELGGEKKLAGIGYYKMEGSTSITIENVEIYVKHTDIDELEDDYTYDTDNFTKVWDGTFPNNVTSGWLDIDFDTKFNYNGTDNLQVLVLKKDQDWTSSRPYWKTSRPSSVERTVYAYDDYDWPTVCNLGTSEIPVTRFSYIDSPDLAVTDATMPEKPYHAGEYPVSATVEWMDGLEATSFDIHVSVNGVEQASASWSGSMDASGDNVEMDLGMVNFDYPAGESTWDPLDVEVWIDNINGNSFDMNNSNNTMSKATTPILMDIGIKEISEPQGNVPLGSKEIKVILKNYGEKPVNSAKIEWTVDGEEQTAFNWSGTLNSLEETEVTIGAYTFKTKVPLAPYIIYATAIMPNGTDSDEYHDNDQSPASTVGPPMPPGSYIVGQGSSFEDTGEFAAYFNASGISGDGTYTVIIEPGTYNTLMELTKPSMPGDYKYVFKSSTGDPDDVKISVSNASSGDAIFGFTDMENITIKGITMEFKGMTGDHIMLENTNNVTIENCRFRNGNNGITQQVDSEEALNLKIMGSDFISLSNTGISQWSSAETNMNYTVIEDNNFMGGSYDLQMGILAMNGGKITGNDFTGLSNSMFTEGSALIKTQGSKPGTDIKDNYAENVSGYNGIIVNGAPDAEIEANNFNIYGGGEGEFGPTGVKISYVNDLLFNQNRILFEGSNPSVEIYACQGIIANNMMVGWNNTAMMLDDNKYLEFIYNSMQNSSDENAPLAIRHDDSKVYRNIASNTGDYVAVDIMNSEGVFLDENIYYNEGDNLGMLDGQPHANLSLWQNITGKEANSRFAKPTFRDYTSLINVTVKPELYFNDPVKSELTEEERDSLELNDYTDQDRGINNIYYAGCNQVIPKISIQSQPQTVIKCEGDTSATVGVSAQITNGDELHYQWFIDGVEIPGANNSVYNFEDGPAEYTMSGFYHCVLTSPGGARTVVSEQAGAYFLSPTEIIKEEVYNEDTDTYNEGASPGDKVRLMVETHMKGMTPPHYKDDFQWYFHNGENDENIPLANGGKYSGAESSELMIDVVEEQDLAAGNYYYVVVTAMCNMVESGKIFIKDIPDYGVEINQDPLDAEECEGSSVFLNVDADPTGDATDLNYQWYKDGAPLSDDDRISGSDKYLLTINPLQKEDAGDYYVEITSVPGDVVVQTQIAEIAVDPLPEFTNVPEQDTFNLEIQETLDIFLSASYANSYQWYKDGAEIDGEVSNHLEITIMREDDAGDYYCVATNDCGDKTSKTFTVKIKSEGSSVRSVSELGVEVLGVNPSPVKEQAVIKFNMPQSMQVNITLNDGNGRKVAELMNEAAHSGLNEVTFNASQLGLSSGVYFYTVQIGQYATTRKLIIVK